MSVTILTLLTHKWLYGFILVYEFIQIRVVTELKLAISSAEKNLSAKLYMICDMLRKFISGELLFSKIDSRK